jgi:hypothetical protein
MTIVRSAMNRTAGRAGARKVNDSPPENAFHSRVPTTEMTLLMQKLTTEEVRALPIANITLAEKIRTALINGPDIPLKIANPSDQIEIATIGTGATTGLQIKQEAIDPTMKIAIAMKALRVPTTEEIILPTIANPSDQIEIVIADWTTSDLILSGVKRAIETIESPSKKTAEEKTTPTAHVLRAGKENGQTTTAVATGATASFPTGGNPL